MAAGNTAAGTGTLALVGPGRAGTTLTLALLELGWEAIAVAGRAPDAPSTQAAAACVDVATKIGKQMLRRSIANINVQRREPARHRAISERRKSVDRIKLIPLPGNQRAAKVRIEKVFAANRDRQSFIGLGRQRFFLAGFARGFLADAFRRSFGEEPVRNAVFNLVCVGYGVEVIESNDLIEIVDAGDASIDDVWFDHMTESN